MGAGFVSRRRNPGAFKKRRCRSPEPGFGRLTSSGSGAVTADAGELSQSQYISRQVKQKNLHIVNFPEIFRFYGQTVAVEFFLAVLNRLETYISSSMLPVFAIGGNRLPRAGAQFEQIVHAMLHGAMHSVMCHPLTVANREIVAAMAVEDPGSLASTPLPGDVDGRVATILKLLRGDSRSVALSVTMADTDIVVVVTVDNPRTCDVAPTWASTSIDDRRIARFRMDMAAAAAAYTAIAEDRLRFVEQPVAACGNFDTELYRERLVRIPDDAGQSIMPSAFLPSLERLGLTRAFDVAVVKKTMEALRLRPDDVLGCNISALSVAHDFWWQGVLSSLDKSPDIAVRMIIEVTETAIPPNAQSAVKLLEAFRERGCRIALDDFGSGHASVAAARNLTPTIIKIDRSLISASSQKPPDSLQRTIGLAGALAPVVVIEGVENGADLSRAAAAGAQWVQGFFIDDWKRRPEIVNDKSVENLKTV